MDFRPEISPDLRPMPEHLFHEEWGALKGIIEAKK
jgi:acyl CoA:acetate/3-ketoacid CoA transferase